MHEATARIRQEATALGFDHVRFAALDPAPGVRRYDQFLAAGHHADMGWMEGGREKRAQPRMMLPAARSAVVLGLRYAWPRPPDPGGLTGKVACYAWGRDYHNLIGKHLKRLRKRLAQHGIESTWGVDARPFIERAWAERAGLGFLGRNCCAIVPGQGSYLFLAVGLVDQALPADPPRLGLERHCGACRRCLDVCPTQAFVGSGQLDARRCISWMTIEHRGPVPTEHRAQVGRWVFGCDDCQEVCPHNHKPPTPLHADLQPVEGRAWLDLEWVLHTEDDVLDAALMGSPLRRAKPWGLKRNAALVLGNLADPAGRPALLRALEHPHPVVQEQARWSLERV